MRSPQHFPHSPGPHLRLNESESIKLGVDISIFGFKSFPHNSICSPNGKNRCRFLPQNILNFKSKWSYKKVMKIVSTPVPAVKGNTAIYVCML